MPTYEYKCLNCNHQFEVFQSIKDDALSVCPECNGKLRRLISGGSGFILKGSGFYQTDYKKTNSTVNTDSTTPTSAKADKKVPPAAATKADSKSKKSSGKKPNKV